MNATIARIATTPNTTATCTEMLGTIAFPLSSSGPLTARITTTQYVNVPMTIPITRLLKGSRKSPCTTRGEYWLDASEIRSKLTENATPAKVSVAPASRLTSSSTPTASMIARYRTETVAPSSRASHASLAVSTISASVNPSTTLYGLSSDHDRMYRMNRSSVFAALNVWLVAARVVVVVRRVVVVVPRVA